MAMLTVLHLPDPRLRTQAEPVTDIAGIQPLIQDMFETMYAENGVGLSANQVGVNLRIAVIDISNGKSERIVAINPEIIHREGKQSQSEGCLSVPTIFDKVERSAKIRMRALGQDGKSYEMDAEGLLAACIQHEIDHLNGTLFIDHLSRLKQERARKKLEKLRKKI